MAIYDDSTVLDEQCQDRKYKVNTAEELVQLAQGAPEFGFLLGPIHYLRELQDGYFYVGMQSEGILGHADAMEIIQGLLKFYETVSPEAIAELKYYIELEEKQRKAAQREAFTSKKRTPVEGYVYLLCSPSGYYKIGRSKNPHSRKATFDVKLPFEVEFEHIIKTDDMIALEEQLHSRFALNRVNGEWFNLSTDDVAYIKSMGGEAC